MTANCKTCGKTISSEAKACPGCGQPQGAARHSAGRSILRVLALLFFILFGLTAWQSTGPQALTYGLLTAICAVVGITLAVKR